MPPICPKLKLQPGPPMPKSISGERILSAEELRKDLVSVSAREPAAHAAAAPSRGGLSELVVRLPLLRVAQHFVGLAHLLEVLLGLLLVVRILVWMILDRKLLVRLGNLLVGRAARHTEHGVVVVAVHVGRHAHVRPRGWVGAWIAMCRSRATQIRRHSYCDWLLPPQPAPRCLQRHG